ncbi:MAG TPA: copper homeostasis protein CutC [Gemmatimonadaceae bacterium]|nr:copper homeostasis protein CutC [Gemmatimonadaceae bacterium]
MTVLVEAAVDSFAGAIAAQAEGAHRIELCGPLHDGGTTPSAGLIARCSDELLVSVHVLIRPRAGDFVYSDDEILIMLKDIAIAKELGVDGVVIGALTPDGDVDVETMSQLIAMASPVRVGFHRAFDQVRDQDEALELLVSLQVDHILTSGGAETATKGAPRLKQLVERADDRIGIIAGGSITKANAANIVRATLVPCIHGRAFQGMAAAVSSI